MALNIEFTHQDQVLTGTILKNKGLYWQVEVADGSTVMVPKKREIRVWEANPLPTVDTDPLGILSMALAAGDNAARIQEEKAAAEAAEPKKEELKAKAVEPEARDPNLLTLKELCFELDIEPRIARRQLRKAQGLVGTGGRWEWSKDSEELAKVRTLLLKAE